MKMKKKKIIIFSFIVIVFLLLIYQQFAVSLVYSINDFSCLYYKNYSDAKSDFDIIAESDYKNGDAYQLLKDRNFVKKQKIEDVAEVGFTVNYRSLSLFVSELDLKMKKIPAKYEDRLLALWHQNIDIPEVDMFKEDHISFSVLMNIKGMSKDEIEEAIRSITIVFKGTPFEQEVNIGDVLFTVEHEV